MLTIDEIKNKINSALPNSPNTSIYLFGSYSKNEQTPDSDIDLLVVSDKKDIANNIVHDLYKKLSDIEMDYDILGYSTQALKKEIPNNSFLKTILNEGIVLYGRKL